MEKLNLGVFIHGEFFGGILSSKQFLRGILSAGGFILRGIFSQHELEKLPIR